MESPTPPQAPRRLVPLWARWILWILLGLVFLGVAGLSLGGWWVEHRTLRHEIRFGEKGENRLRVHGAKFSWWSLRFNADSAWYRSPGMDVRIGTFKADVDLFGALLSFMPAAKITADSTYLRVKVDTTPKEKIQLDSIAFPDFRIPLAVSVRVRRLVVEDDSGLMARADTVWARNRGGQMAEAGAASIRSRWTKNLSFGATAYADWSVTDSVDARLTVLRVRNGETADRVNLKARHAKRPLWHGREDLEATLQQTAPYAKALGMDSLPNARNVRLKVSARLSRSPAMDLNLSGETDARALSGEFTLSPQKVNLTAAWKDKRGTMRLQSRGRAGEDVLLQAEGRVLPGLEGRDSVTLEEWLEHAAISVRGHAKNFRVRVQDTVRSADLVIERADWDGGRLSVDLLTGDGSRLEAAGRKQPERWNASFSLNVNPRERWLRVFTGDNISFASLNAQGEAQGRTGSKEAPTLNATVSARKLNAYGVKLDSARTDHGYGPGGYVLKPSRLYDGKTVWTLAGTAKPAKKTAGKGGVALDFTLSSPGHGSLRYTQDAAGTMEGRAELFDVGALPYARIDSLPFQDPVLDGTFRWNPERKSGAADLGAQAHFKKEQVEARVKGSWDAKRLDLQQTSVKVKSSELDLSARLRLNGRQFYEAWKVKPAQYEYVSVRTPGFDIAEVMKIFQPEPALSKGSVDGELSYADGAGFKGQLTFKAITPHEAIGDVVLKELSLEGNGDTLLVAARTTSASVKPLNARLRVAVSSLLREEQHVRADLAAGDLGKAGDSILQIRLDATSRNFQSLRGTLTANGKVVLPDKSGSIEKINVNLAFDVPAANPLKRSTLTAGAFDGVYVLPGLTRQTFSLNPVLRNGIFQVSRLSVKNDQGQSIAGRLEYNLEKNSLTAHVDGERFAAQWADDYKADLKNLSFDFSRDKQGLRLGGGFASGSFLYVDAPLYARGTLTSVRFEYDQPASFAGPGSARQRRNEAPATLTFFGNLSESLIRYRLKTFADLQKVFRKDRKKRSAEPLRLNVKVQTLGNDNHIDSDLLRLTWVGDLSIRGVNPYTLFNGRINALNGGLGLDKQAYDVTRFEVKWLNAPMEEGKVNMEARKELASDCNRRNEADVDSCVVITRLDGELSRMQFSYDSDCGGSFGAGASVAAILYSVQRGCYDASFATGGGGGGYGDKALTLLEPTLNRGLTNVVGKYSSNWIEATEVSGLGSLSRDNGGTGDTLGEALSLGLTSKEFLRLRLKLGAGYYTASQDLSNPWEYTAALEWRPPADRLVRSPSWKRRLNDNLRAFASLQTIPARIDESEEDEIEKKIGLNYTYFFWGNWWSKPRKREETDQPVMVKPAQTSGEPVK